MLTASLAVKFSKYYLILDYSGLKKCKVWNQRRTLVTEQLYDFGHGVWTYWIRFISCQMMTMQSSHEIKWGSNLLFFPSGAQPRLEEPQSAIFIYVCHFFTVLLDLSAINYLSQTSWSHVWTSKDWASVSYCTWHNSFQIVWLLRGSV